MSFLAPLPALIAAGIAIPALVSLYFLKLRRRRVEIASTLLWKKAVKDMEVNAPFQKLKRNLLLLIQLLLLAALLFAMARPVLDQPVQKGQLLVLAIDHSGSMNASDVKGFDTRLAKAKDRALDMIDQMSGGGMEAMVISYAGQARVVQPRTNDPAALRAAIRSIQPTDQTTGLSQAMSMVVPFAQQAIVESGQTEEAPVRLVVLSDGQRGEERAISLSDIELAYERVGSETDEPTNNVAIIAFAVRRDFERPQDVSLFARLANFGPDTTRTAVSLELDGQLIRVENVNMRGATDAGPGIASMDMQFRMAGSGLVTLYHDHEDALSSDDRVWLALASPRRVRVLMVGTGNAFLEKGLRSAGVRDLTQMTPEKFENQSPESLVRKLGEGVTLSESGYDVIVFDRYEPKEIPLVPSLSFGAVLPMEGLERIATDQGTGPILDWRRSHPLLRYVALDDVQVVDPGRLVLPDNAEVLATAQSGPVMALLTHEGRWHVVVSFDVLSSNWPFFVSYPMFLTHSVETLGLGKLLDSAAIGYQPGQSITLPVPMTDSVRYVGPVVVQARPTANGLTTGSIERAGLYSTRNDAVGPPYDRLAVNMLDAQESDIRPVEVLEIASSSGQAAVGATEGGIREIWPWFAIGALVLLMLEWVIYTRRMHL